MANCQNEMHVRKLLRTWKNYRLFNASNWQECKTSPVPNYLAVGEHPNCSLFAAFLPSAEILLLLRSPGQKNGQNESRDSDSSFPIGRPQVIRNFIGGNEEYLREIRFFPSRRLGGARGQKGSLSLLKNESILYTKSKLEWKNVVL